MRKSLLGHLNYANVAATAALVFAMGGGALAATHYLINSTKQINPAVMRKLQGRSGKSGVTGPQGAPGLQGPVGPQGQEGPRGLEGKAQSGAAAYEMALKPSLEELPAGASRTLTLADIPPGAYAISAKALIAPVEEAKGAAECVLAAGSGSDRSIASLGPSSKPAVTLSDELTHTFGGTSTVTLTCEVSGNEWTLEEGTRIVAVKVQEQHASSGSAG